MVDGPKEVPTTTPEADMAAGGAQVVGNELDRIEESLEVVRVIMASGALRPNSEHYQRLEARAQRLAADLHGLLGQDVETEPAPDARAEPETDGRRSFLLEPPDSIYKLFDYKESPDVQREFALEALPQVEPDTITELHPRALSILNFSLIEARARYGPPWRWDFKRRLTAREYLGLFKPPKSMFEIRYGVGTVSTFDRIKDFAQELPVAEVEQLVADVQDIAMGGDDELLGRYVDLPKPKPVAEHIAVVAPEEPEPKPEMFE